MVAGFIISNAVEPLIVRVDFIVLDFRSLWSQLSGEGIPHKMILDIDSPAILLRFGLSLGCFAVVSDRVI